MNKICEFTYDKKGNLGNIGENKIENKKFMKIYENENLLFGRIYYHRHLAIVIWHR